MSHEYDVTFDGVCCIAVICSVTPSFSSDSPEQSTPYESTPYASPYATLNRPGVKPPPSTPICASVEASPELRRKRLLSCLS